MGFGELTLFPIREGDPACLKSVEHSTPFSMAQGWTREETGLIRWRTMSYSTGLRTGSTKHITQNATGSRHRWHEARTLVTSGDADLKPSECSSQFRVEFSVTCSQNNPDTGWTHLPAAGCPDLLCWPAGCLWEGILAGALVGGTAFFTLRDLGALSFSSAASEHG